MADMRTVWNADTQEWEYYEIVEVSFVEIRNYDDRFIDEVVVSKEGCLNWTLALCIGLAYSLFELIRYFA